MEGEDMNLNMDTSQIFSLFSFFVALLFVCGIYCIVITRNLIRTVIGLELLVKAVTLFIIVCGYTNGRLALAQAMVITIIVIEVIITAVAGGIILSIYRKNNSLYTRRLRTLKG
jgi:multisubunit Na+/H+ antiporter MnhC subunit